MYVAKKDRTAASALFVSLSAVGMALGPLLALPLSHVPDLSFAGVSFNSITMGGWVMTGAWLLFLAVAAAFFEDPLDRVRGPAGSKWVPPVFRVDLSAFFLGRDGWGGGMIEKSESRAERISRAGGWNRFCLIVLARMSVSVIER